MNIKRFGLSVVVVFIFIYLFEWLFHGMYMHSMYEQTAQFWRGEEQMQQYFPFLLLGQFVVALMFCFIYTKGYQGFGIMEGVRYGIYMAILLNAPLLMWYAVSTYPTDMLIKWAVGGFAEIIFAGIILSLVYQSET